MHGKAVGIKTYVFCIHGKYNIPLQYAIEELLSSQVDIILASLIS